MKRIILNYLYVMFGTLILYALSTQVINPKTVEASSSTQCYLKLVVNLPNGPNVWHCEPDGDPTKKCDSTEGACGGEDSELRFFD